MATYIVSISKVVSQEIFEKKLLALYFKLASDNIWGVRKITVEVMPQISEICSPEIR